MNTLQLLNVFVFIALLYLVAAISLNYKNNSLDNKYQYFSASIIFTLLMAAYLILISHILFYIFNITPNTYQIISAVTLALGLSIFIFFRVSGRVTTTLSFLITALIIFFSIYLTKFVYDYSFDGLFYHQEGVLALSGGWNPLTGQHPGNTWVNSYPKAAWILGSSIHRLTGAIETGKSINFVLVILVFLASTYFLNIIRLGNNLSKILISSAITLNPVVIRQIFTFYVDGLLYSFFVIQIIFLAIVIKKGRSFHISDILVVIIATSILANLKFTGAVYAAVNVFLAILISYFYNKNNFRFITKIALACALSTLFIGANPYLDNILNGKHIFYPLLGKEKTDLAERIHPPCLDDTNRIIQLVDSTFSKPQYAKTCSDIEYLNPFDLVKNKNQYRNIAAADSGWSLGAFGPYFGTITLLGFLLYLIIFTNKIVLRTIPNRPIILFLLLSVFLNTFLNPELWWARYVPQWWIFWLPAVVLFFSAKPIITGKVISYCVLLISIISTTFLAVEVVHKHANHNANYLGITKSALKVTSVFAYGNNYPFRSSLDNRFRENGIEIIDTTAPSPDMCGIKLISPYKDTGGYYSIFGQNQSLGTLKASGANLEKTITDIEPDDTVIIVTKGKGINSVNKTIKKVFKDWNIPAESLTNSSSLAAIIHEGKAIFSIAHNRNATIQTEINRLNIKATSSPSNKTQLTSISVDGIELSPKMKGYNIVTLDDNNAVRYSYSFSPENSGQLESCRPHDLLPSW